jgi:hypothetical protein
MIAGLPAEQFAYAAASIAYVVYAISLWIRWRNVRRSVETE